MSGGIGHFLGSGLVLPPSLFGGAGGVDAAFQADTFQNNTFQV